MTTEKIKRLRRLLGLSQKEMAERLHMDQSAYSRLENGKVQLSVDRLRMLSAIFEVSAADLLSNEPFKIVLITLGDRQLGSKTKNRDYLANHPDETSSQIITGNPG